MCTAPINKFDPKINSTHTQECLKRLLCMYDEQKDRAPVNLAEFVCLYLLFNLESTDALTYALELKNKLR